MMIVDPGSNVSLAFAFRERVVHLTGTVQTVNDVSVVLACQMSLFVEAIPTVRPGKFAWMERAKWHRLNV